MEKKQISNIIIKFMFHNNWKHALERDTYRILVGKPEEATSKTNALRRKLQS
jgi:hypothetical protein